MVFNRRFDIPQHTNKFPKYDSEIFTKKQKFFKVGRDIQPKRDLKRFIKWPLYIKVQRERKILGEKLKIPPIINQFSKILDKNMSKQLFKILSTHTGLSSQYDNNNNNNKKILNIKHGINTVTHSIQKGNALFVIIANDVNPIELVIWLPELCRKTDTPFCIVKDKSRLGKIVNKKNTSSIAITYVCGEEKEEVDKMINYFKLYYNNRYEESTKR